jgi:outer membrane protein assembly factor BamA
LAAGALCALIAPPCAAQTAGADAKLDSIQTAQPVVVSTASATQKSAVGSGYSFVPLPAFMYNRNEGAWVGGLIPIFRANEKGQIEDIFAPLYLYNNLIGDTFTFNYFGYRRATQQYHVILSQATKVEHTVDLSYKDTGFHDGRYIVSLQANTGKSAFNRFYGFGNNSVQSAESNYALGDTNVIAAGGVHLTDTLVLTATERYRSVTIRDGVVSSLPQTPQAFPTAPGIDGETLWGQALTFSYDTRDNPLTPLKGTYATASGESDQNYKLDNRDQWWRTTSEFRNYLPHDDDRAVFVTHAMFDYLAIDKKGLVRQGVPFYERPTLGGENTLRGFGDGRFVSSFSILFNVEERYSVIQRTIMGNAVEFNVAPFLDIGRVGRTFSYNGTIKNVQFNPGVGFRFLARPNIASRVDVGYGKDGANVFVGLDYPF